MARSRVLWLYFAIAVGVPLTTIVHKEDYILATIKKDLWDGITPITHRLWKGVDRLCREEARNIFMLNIT